MTRLTRLHWYLAVVYMLARRDFLVRYKQASLGVLWAFARPLVTAAVLTFVFHRVAQVPTANVPYPLFVFAGLMPWQLFAGTLTATSNSLIQNQKIITATNLPRILIPLSAVAVQAIDIAVVGGILVVLMVWYQYPPTWQLSLLPAFLLLVVIAALGLGLLLAGLNVYHRDVRHAVPLIVQFGLYLSPVGFSSQLVPASAQPWYNLNPLVPAINGARWALLNQPFEWQPTLLVSLCLSIAVLIAGSAAFTALSRSAPDVV